MAGKKTEKGKNGKKTGISDALVILIFLSIVIVITFASGAINKSEGTEPQALAENQDGQVLASRISSEIIAGDVLDVDMIEELARKNYYQLKNELEADSDFVIYFEDENGTPVEVVGRSCIGSGHARIDGQNCDR